MSKKMGLYLNLLFFELAGDGRRPLALLGGGEAVGGERLEEAAPHVVVRRVVPDGRGPHVGPGHEHVVEARRPLLPVQQHLGLVRHLLLERQLRTESRSIKIHTFILT